MEDIEMRSPMITLESSDGQRFEVEAKVAQCSTVFKDMMETLGTIDNVISVPALAPHISGHILHKIIQWAGHHKDDPAPAEGDDKKVKFRHFMSRWDADFLSDDLATVFQLIRAADFLDIKGLLQVTCEFVAKMVEEKTADEVRGMLNIPSDFIPAEESQVRDENEWFEDMNVRPEYDANIPPDYVQNVDNEAGQVMADCLSNSNVVEAILEHFDNAELIELSLVNKLWSHTARSVMRKRGNVMAFVSVSGNTPASVVFQSFQDALKQMNVVPFSGITIEILSTSLNHNFQVPLKRINDETLARLPFKHLSVSLLHSVLLPGGYTGHPVLVLLKTLFQDFSEHLEQLTLNIAHEQEEFIQHFVQDCSFSNLKVLKLEEDNDDMTVGDAYTNYIRNLVVRAPNLQELHTVGLLNLMENVLEGTDAELFYKCELRFPEDEIAEGLLDKLRLETLHMEYLPQEGNFERINSMMPRLLQTSSATLRSLTFNARLAAPLMRHNICLRKVEELMVTMNFSELMEHPLILRILKNFDFSGILNSCNGAKVRCCHDYMDMLPDYSNAIIEQAGAYLPKPYVGRAVYMRELRVDYMDYPDFPVPFFGQMFPDVENVELNMLDGRAISFGSVWEHWADLEELKITGLVVQRAGNLDSDFCGIFPEEVAELRLEDEKYLEKVNIVPVRPAITCLENLKTLTLNREEHNCDDGPCVDDGTFMFSKVTEWIVFKRRPTLAVSLNFPNHMVS